jgi:adenylate kinase family enzyme
MLGLPLHSIDQLQWQPGWQPTPPHEFEAAHTKLFSEPRWIIDGWGSLEMIQERFRRADTIILVDYPLWRHYWWAIKRQVECIFRPRIDGPSGCPMIPMTWPLLKMIWRVDQNLMPKTRALVNAQRGQATIFHLRTLTDLRNLFTEVKNQDNAVNLE